MAHDVTSSNGSMPSVARPSASSGIAAPHDPAQVPVQPAVNPAQPETPPPGPPPDASLLNDLPSPDYDPTVASMQPLTAPSLLQAVANGDAATFGRATETMISSMGQLATLQGQYAVAAGSGNTAEAQRIADVYRQVESELAGLLVAVVRTSEYGAGAGDPFTDSPRQLASIQATVSDVQARLANAHNMYGSAPTSSLERLSAALQPSAVAAHQINDIGELWNALSTVVANNGTLAGDTMRAQLETTVVGELSGADERLKQAAAKKHAQNEEQKAEKAHEAQLTKRQAENLELNRHRERIRKQDDMLELQRMELFEDREVARTGHVEELQMTDQAAELHNENIELSRAYAEGDDIDVTRLRDDDPLPPRPIQIQ